MTWKVRFVTGAAYGNMVAGNPIKWLAVMALLSYQQWYGLIFALSLTRFEPSINADGSLSCAVDVPTTVIAIDDIVGIPDAVPDAIRCGHVCTGFVNCTSYNHKYGVISAGSSGSGSSTTRDSVCELFTNIPRNCTTQQHNFNCIHYQVQRKYKSCQPLVCDPQCTSGCIVQQDDKCDAKCTAGWFLRKNFTCGQCDVNCASNCSSEGTCDSICRVGWGLSADKTCQPCDANCADVCNVYGSSKCDTRCKIGWNLSSQHVCKWCPPNFTYNQSTDSCYNLSSSSMIYTMGASYCQTLNSRLAFIETADEVAAVVSYVQRFDPQASSTILIGGCRTTASGDVSTQFVWSTDCSQTGPSLQAVTSPFYYSLWDDGQPANYGYGASQPGSGQWCVILQASNSARPWNDKSCSDTGRVLCEVNAYVPPCDLYCVSGCSVQGCWKCDSQCDTGWYLSPNFTCKACQYQFTYLPAGDSCYRAVMNSYTSHHDDAAKFCIDINSRLAYIKSEQEQTSNAKYIKSLYPATATQSIGFWIGGCEDDTTWVWSTDCSYTGPSNNAVMSAMTYENWSAGQPANTLFERRCVFMLSGSNGFKWFNGYCASIDNYAGMLCQKDALTSGCPYGFSRVGHQYSCYKLVTTQLIMSDASVNCRNLTGGSDNSHLAYIENADEMTDVATFLRGFPATSPGGVCYSNQYPASFLLMGACRVSVTGTSQFVWANQCTQQGLPSTAVTVSMNYTNWAYTEPNGATSEYCIMMGSKTDGSAQWFDITCDLALCSLCELECP